MILGAGLLYTSYWATWSLRQPRTAWLQLPLWYPDIGTAMSPFSHRRLRDSRGNIGLSGHVGVGITSQGLPLCSSKPYSNHLGPQISYGYGLYWHGQQPWSCRWGSRVAHAAPVCSTFGRVCLSFGQTAYGVSLTS